MLNTTLYNHVHWPELLGQRRIPIPSTGHVPHQKCTQATNRPWVSRVQPHMTVLSTEYPGFIWRARCYDVQYPHVTWRVSGQAVQIPALVIQPFVWRLGSILYGVGSSPHHRCLQGHRLPQASKVLCFSITSHKGWLISPD